MLSSVEVRITDESPEAVDLVERTNAIVARIAPGVEVRVARLRKTEDSPGPSVRINGHPLKTPSPSDASDPGGSPPSGPPPDWLIEASLVSALEPRHILFMCVANSARSQMAEGMARALAPPGVTISSAGSEPAFVRPDAVTAMKEIGIDITDQYSKSLDRVEVDTVQVVVTLCAEEVCPVFLEPVPRLHWPIPDPAPKDGEEGEEAERLAAFRQARDAIRERLYVLFHGSHHRPAG